MVRLTRQGQDKGTRQGDHFTQDKGTLRQGDVSPVFLGFRRQVKRPLVLTPPCLRFLGIMK
jgi:hypothetical protein